MDHPEGAGSQRADRVDFDRRVRLEFRGAQLSSDGGLLVTGELDDALGLSDLASAALRDTRSGKNTVHRLYEDVFAAENYKTFLRCTSKIIRSEGGEIRSFDGDRVMGIFICDTRFDAATRCGLKINWAVKNIVKAKMKAQYPMGITPSNAPESSTRRLLCALGGGNPTCAPLQ